MAGYLKPVTIVGGGLAGLSLGIALLRRGVAVTVHEAGHYPRHRVCGEFISGVADETLERLGIFSHLRDAAPLRSARWYSPEGPVAALDVEARGISRYLLDDRLQADFRKSGGTLLTGSRVPSGEQVVWAAGRPRTPSRWIGLKCHVKGLELSSDLEMHLGSNGYVGLAKIEGGEVNVCGLFRAAPGRGGRGALAGSLRAGGLGRLAERIFSARPDPDSFCAVAGFVFGRQPGPEFSVGDAAQMIPPFTGNGMSMAFESAACALGPLLEFAAGKLGWDEAAAAAQAAQRRTFRRRLSVAIRLQQLLDFAPGLACSLARYGCLPAGFLLRLVR